VIDYPSFKFARAEIATLRERFEYVAATAPQGIFDGTYGGNIVLVAAHRRLDNDQLETLVSRHGDVVLDGAALDRFVATRP
jgi:hypothetical protein